MSFAACGGALYATIWDQVVVRTDGASPSWSVFAPYTGPTLPNGTSGLRGLTCVPNTYGSGSMLIASMEGPGDVYEFPLDGSAPSIELHMTNYLATELGTWINYSTAAFNNMVAYPNSGTASCPDLMLGVGYIVVTSSYAGAYHGKRNYYYPKASLIIRHCNGAYAMAMRTVNDPSKSPMPPLIASRSIAVSQFTGDPAGTLYMGGFEVDSSQLPALDHNTDWIYKGSPD